MLINRVNCLWCEQRKHSAICEQFEQLKTAYVNTIVDSMSSKGLYQYVLNDMDRFVDKLTDHDLIEEIKYTLDEDFLDEMLLTITENRKG